MTINDRTYELAQGRVFMIRADGTLRQIVKHPERLVTKDELNQFVAELPPEQ